MIAFLSLLFVRVQAQNAIFILIHLVNNRSVFGNEADPITITELPGYTGWNRDRINSNVDQCFINRIGNQTFALESSLNTFYHVISNPTNIWTILIACPNITATTEQGHISKPLFYSRASIDSRLEPSAQWSKNGFTVESVSRPPA